MVELHVLICPWCYLTLTAEKLKSYLAPPQSLQSVCKSQTGDSIWVRDYRPNAVQKWMKGTIVTPVGTLTYNVHVGGSNHRKVHSDHLLNRVPEVTSETIQFPSTTPDSGSRDEMILVTSQHTTATTPEDTIDLSVTQQEDTTPSVRLHDSESLETEHSTMMELQAPSPVNLPITEISSPATASDSLQPKVSITSQEGRSQQPLCRNTRQIKRHRRLVEEMN